MELGAFLFTLVLSVSGAFTAIDFYKKGEMGLAIGGFIISGICLLIVALCIRDMFKGHSD